MSLDGSMHNVSLEDVTVEESDISTEPASNDESPGKSKPVTVAMSKGNVATISRSSNNPMNIIKRYKHDSREKREQHKMAETYYDTLSSRLSLSSSILAAGGSIITLLQGALSLTPVYSYLSAGVMLGSMIVTGIGSAYKVNKKSKDHRSAQLRYGTVVKESDRILISSYRTKIVSTESINKIIDIMEHADSMSPTINNKLLK